MSQSDVIMNANIDSGQTVHIFRAEKNFKKFLFLAVMSRYVCILSNIYLFILFIQLLRLNITWQMGTTTFQSAVELLDVLNLQVLKQQTKVCVSTSNVTW